MSDFIKSNPEIQSDFNSAYQESLNTTDLKKLSAQQIIQNRLKLLEEKKNELPVNQEMTILEKETYNKTNNQMNNFVMFTTSKGKAMHYKCDLATLEYPFFAFRLSKNNKEFSYNEKVIKLKPNSSGLATMMDKELWIYAITKLVELRNEGKNIARTIHFHAYDYLKTIKGDTGGKTYKEFLQSLERLCGTRVYTNIETDKVRERGNFGLFDSYYIKEESDKEKMAHVEITLPDWVFRSITSNQIKTISSEYFNIRKPVYRRLYEIGLKHCSEQQSFKISVEKLFEKLGSAGHIRDFRQDLKTLTAENNLPDYHFRYDEDEKVVYFINRRVKGVAALVKNMTASKKI